nr:hypothetical protein [Salmonella enterica subsp. salamae]
MDSICSSSGSSKRMCFIVLPERSKSFFIFACCIGSYHWCNVVLDGNYHRDIKQLKTATPRSAVTLARRLTTNDNRSIKVAMKNHTTQSQIVYLPYVCAVDPESSQIQRWIQKTENQLLDRVKAALDEAGVAWIDPRTKERSKPTTNAEGCDNAQ